ncbi:copper resistance protein B [Sphingomonas sp. KR1UV-12]|uniref:Copper resistance protein B n=1 Tax=Sphingomonas aurea TaxID=3063994 RepID=A0ABT9EKT6_9SPHN|nr:copper resistance protein B [Sphingomonas sp. KR1UV-12]MDP1027579.1 copper resistance protein B [Sphingomonas sp. KR1UV-12]
MNLAALMMLAATTQDHAHMHHAPAEQAAADAPADQAIPQGTPPPIPRDHAADTVWDPDAMAQARAGMIREHGGGRYSQLMLDRLEYRAVRGRDGYAWEGEGWIGGDIDRFAIATEGEGEIGGPLEEAEVQALYRHAIGPWFNLETGVRQDFRDGADRTHAVFGIDGLAPYWFDVSAQAFVSTRGEVQARLEASYDQRITQRLILQPAIEVTLAAQDIPALAVGAGLSQAEVGVRLRYEIRREFAPYIGIHAERRFGDAARFARALDERASGTSVVAGVRFWF